MHSTSTTIPLRYMDKTTLSYRVCLYPSRRKHTHSPPIAPVTTVNEPPTSMLHSLHEQSPSSKWSIHDFTCLGEGQELAEAIQQGYAKAVSDGSYKDQRGTSAFSLYGKTEEPNEPELGQTSIKLQATNLSHARPHTHTKHTQRPLLRQSVGWVRLSGPRT
jgi:hypothetical protein